MVRYWMRLFAGFAVAAAAAGCGDNSPPAGPPVAKPYPVRGQVTLKNKSPLRGGVIYFTPVEIQTGSKMRYEGAGLVDAKGQFTIGLNGDGTGVPAGEYKVTAQPREYQELKNSNTRSIPPQYREKSSTPITFTVKEEENVVKLELK